MAKGEKRVGEVIAFASRSGLPMGLYLTLISACLIFSLQIDALGFVALVLMCGIPVLLWRLMMPLADAQSRPGFGSIWLGGIYCFIFASMISGLISGVYLTFCEPAFMARYVQKGIEAYQAAGSPAELEPQMRIMQLALERKMLPDSMEIVSSMMWITAFFGSVLSLAEALVMSNLRRVRRSFE